MVSNAFGSLVWMYGPDKPADSDSTIFPKTRQIKYGQEIKGFRSKVPPQELQNNLDYYAEIGVSGRIWKVLANYHIVNNNKVVMTRGFNKNLPKNPSLIIERNGKKITVPYSVSFDKDGHKVITTEPVQEN